MDILRWSQAPSAFHHSRGQSAEGNSTPLSFHRQESNDSTVIIEDDSLQFDFDKRSEFCFFQMLLSGWQERTFTCQSSSFINHRC